MPETKPAKAIARKYNLLANLYDHIWPHYIKTTISLALSPLKLAGSEHLLDIGCGTGALERALIKKYPQIKITGIDLSKDMLARAQKKIGAHPNVILMEGDFLKIDLPLESFDTVFSISNLHYFHNPQAIFTKSARLLKKGGTFVLVDWSRHSLKAKIYNAYMKTFDPGFAKVYSPEEASTLLKEGGFQIESTHSQNVSLFWYMMRIVAKKT